MATVTKRNDTYRIRVSCGYDSGGKQIRRHKTWKPTEGMTPKQIEKELERQKVLFEEKCQSGQVVDGNIKLSEFCPQYLDILRSSNSAEPTTIQMYERVIELYIIPTLGHIRLKNIKPIHIQRFIQEISGEVPNLKYKEGSTQPKTIQLKPATIRRYYVVLQSILSRACKLEMIAVNPADSDKIDLPTLKQQEIEIFTKDELNRVFTCLDNEPIMYQALIHLAIVTGCRRGELIALQWNCIDFDNSAVKIKQSNYKLKGEEITSKSTKSNKIRTISIPEYCVQYLK